MKSILKTQLSLYKNILQPKSTTKLAKAIQKIEAGELAEDNITEELVNNVAKSKGITYKELEDFNGLAYLVNHDEKLTQVLWDKHNDDKVNFKTVADLARNFDSKALGSLFHANQIPKTIAGETQKEKEQAFVADLEKKLFKEVPVAGLQRVMDAKTLELPNANIVNGVTSFLEAHSTFDIRKKQLREILAEDTIIKALESEEQVQVLGTLKNLQRLSTISNRPEEVAVLYNKNFYSSHQISKMDADRFVATFSDTLGAQAAKTIHNNAIANVTNNAYRVMQLKEYAQGTQVAMIDNAMGVNSKTTPEGTTISYEALFGNTDFCECGHCNSVYSPSAYFVELLEYIRSNNLEIEKKGYEGTPLDKLFWRRPDLKCLQLTCTNAFTVLPYIDLVNEVMESFIAHNDNVTPNGKKLKIQLDTYNTTKEDESSTLLAQPQNIHKRAYEILDEAVYPFSLPYNQPLDATRQYLEHLNTSRYELMTTFDSAINGQQMIEEDPSIQPSARAETMQGEEEKRRHRAQCAEYLGLSESQFTIIAQEGFATKEYYQTLENRPFSDKMYAEKIGIKSVEQYYFEKKDIRQLKKLAQVKEEFLPRTGLTYAELVDVLKTNYINPYQPQGVAKVVLEELQISYAFLQSLIDKTQNDPIKKYKPVVDFIYQWHHYLQLKRNVEKDPCSDSSLYYCLNKKDILNWVFYHFENIGKMIVLESNLPSQFAYPGIIITKPISESQITVDSLGQIITNDTVIGQIKEDFSIEWEQNLPFGAAWLVFNEETIGEIERNDTGVYVLKPYENYVSAVFFKIIDTCDISKVRLQHLDGTALTEEDYSRFHRFIRLWRKTDWELFQLDSAIIGLNAETEIIEPIQAVEDYIQQETQGTDDCNCKKLGRPSYLKGQLNAELICELASVKKLLQKINISLDRLLCFWSPIETKGETPLYAKLLLRKNLIAKNPVFAADANGSFLSQPSLKISGHIPALMAGLSIKGDAIELLDQELGLNDELTLKSVSSLYRHQLLARYLRCSMSELLKAKRLFGNPFDSIAQTIAFLYYWEAMKTANLSIEQLQFLFTANDDIENPVLPPAKDQLKLVKDIWAGIVEIEVAHAEEITKDSFTTEFLKKKLEALYDPEIVEEIIAFLSGNKIWTTNVPAGLSVDLSAYSQIKVGSDATLTVKGILTNEDQRAIALLGNLDLDLSLERIQKQQQYFFHTYFSDVLEAVEKATDKQTLKRNLLAKHEPPFEDPNDLNNNKPGSTIDKGVAFLKEYVPYLRETLKNRLIATKMGDALNLSIEAARYLLEREVNINGTNTSLLLAFRTIGERPASLSSDYTGFLLPDRTANYIFEVVSESKEITDSNGSTSTIETKGTILINGTKVETLVIDNPHGLYPSNIYRSKPVSLESGEVYEVGFINLDESLSKLKWKVDDKVASGISTSLLFEKHIVDGFQPPFELVFRASLLVNAYELSVKELQHLETYATSFDGFYVMAPTISQWKHLHTYRTLKEQLPKDTQSDLIDLFFWAEGITELVLMESLYQKIHEATNWDIEKIKKLVAQEHFNVDVEKLRNAIGLTKMLQAIQLQYKVNAPCNTLFDWAKAPDEFDGTWKIAENIQQVVQARYDLDDWEEIVKPINDQLRTNQRNALIAYLLNQKALQDWGVTDADALFEFFLIDVQMESCMETSRIKQAISTTQLFIQRVLLNLEDMSGINEPIDRDDEEDHIFDKRRQRWQWMSRYRVWEANRKVFLYPENWIRPELRDTKTELYQAMESELLQKDINPDMVKDVLKNYLYGLDEIADMKVVGMYAVKDDNNDLGRLHVISRTRTAPYFFYYRKYENGYWYPWKKMQVDIPSYDHEVDGQIESNGAYVIPVEWNNRLFVFFPQFLKKTKPKKEQEVKKFTEIAEEPMNNNKPDEFWEIKMAFSERKNGVWSQKKVSEKSIYTSFLQNKNEFLFKFSFNEDGLNIFQNNERKLNDIKGFFFDGKCMKLETAIKDFNHDNYKSQEFHYNLYLPFNFITTHSKNQFDFKIYFKNDSKSIHLSSPDNFYSFKHNFSQNLIQTISLSDLKSFFNYINNNPSVNNQADIHFGGDTNETNQKIFHELKQAYSIYNWELFFHLPVTVAQTLRKNQQFEEAMQWYHFVFHPYENGTEADRFWRFLPFRETDAQNYLEKFFQGLAPGLKNMDITAWRDDPFNPHNIARSRTVAYMKWVVMEYLDNLLDWGDYLFRQDTIESVNYATQLYVLAGHILGKRPQQIPKRGKIKPQSYVQLLPKLDAFSNAKVEMELLFPFSNQVFPLKDELVQQVPVMNILGMATTQYFCTPNNPKLMGYWDTVADRLFKIRHCQNIEGVFRKLSLFEPPIDPALLVNARANGLSISSVLNDLYAPIPNYRFNYVLQKAFELCNEVKSLGNQFLSLKEKKDGETMQLLRSKHEVALNDLLLETRKSQLEEAQKSLDGLLENRKSPEYRMKYYLQLIGEDLEKIPDEDIEFIEIADKIEALKNEGGLKLIPQEYEELDKANQAANWQIASGVTETLGGILSVIPDTEAAAKFFGVGAGVTFGGSLLGNAASAVARGFNTVSSQLSFNSSNASRMAAFTRQLQERIQQCNLAGRECKQIDKQIAAQRIRIDIANQEITNHQKQIENSKEVEEFLKTKYTNEQLYQYLEGHVKTLFYQAYTMAYDLAKKAEGLFRFERGLTSTNFIKYGYWNSAYDGLMAGEQLYNGLKQLEIAYQDKRGHDYEIVNKQISLRKLNPMQLLELRETGSCEFEVPEWLFDMDFAGHYIRRIKTVSFSLPCISGPYINISATARLLEHSFRVKPTATGDYSRNLNEDDERFMTSNVPIQAVALSSGQNDGGVFELNFRDERYMPFEGAGCISRWRIELSDFKQFDYHTISDVVLHMSYTSKEGGSKLKTEAIAALEDITTGVTNLSKEEGLFAFFDLKHDFSQEWYKGMNSTETSRNHKLVISNLIDRFPYFTQNKKIEILFKDIFINDKEQGMSDNIVIDLTQATAGMVLENLDESLKQETSIYLVLKYKITS